MGPNNSCFAPIAAGYNSLLSRLKQGVQFADRRGEPNLHFLEVAVALAVQPGYVQAEFPLQLIGTLSRALNHPFQAVQHFQRFVQAHEATHSRS